MATVRLTDIVTDADRAAVLALRAGEIGDRFVGSVEQSFQDAIDDAEAEPRMWAATDAATGEVVGFVMLSDGISLELLAADPTLVGPYYLWRLLIDEGRQGQGYGTAAIDAIVEYLRTRPGADILWVSCGLGDGSPKPFYERYGFVDTGELFGGESLLRLDLPREDR